MDPFTMVVAIVAIAIGAGVINNYIKARSREPVDLSSRAEFVAMRDDVARLKERVRVLEKIVTDQERQLSDEIRRLA
ncbi:hypothetical protein K1X12_05315 [Hyphomonas sp. WL0036]|uniref:hypothetical protein n=1 Tax=Hyphomonas sediminis TaxID=2866160 RepID=UPI001C7E80A4|nr:hypothetical protein [Hyphomonas sediminis]MBY9066307.1 hypothetical protein [Hyphomonas sediminis]